MVLTIEKICESGTTSTFRKQTLTKFYYISLNEKTKCIDRLCSIPEMLSLNFRNQFK